MVKLMAGEIFEFSWFRHRDGYSIREVRASTSHGVEAAAKTAATGSTALMVSANSDPVRGLGEMEQYNPLRQYKCLFRNFAEAGLDSNDIVAFADRHGLLGFERETADRENPPIPGNMESLSRWRGEIIAMRKALALWDMVQEEDSSGLSSCLSPIISWVEADTSGRTDKPLPEPGTACPDFEPEDLRWFRTHPEVIEWYGVGDMSVPALMWVQAITNQHLEKRISPRILWEDRRRRRWSLYFTPISLIGAIWLQFAQSVTQEKDYRRCRQCESWFEIDHYTARTNRYFCSNACRSKAYRMRQSKARELYGQGMGLAEIAGQLGSDEATVSRWVEKAAR